MLPCWRRPRRSGGKIFFPDEAHFRADAELRGKWVLRGEPALVDSTGPRRGKKASYYSAVCLEPGGIGVDGTGGKQQRRTLSRLPDATEGKAPWPIERLPDGLAPVHRGEAVRKYLRSPSLELRLVNLPGYSPDFNADEAIWG